jgi:hypothetical protein
MTGKQFQPSISTNNARIQIRTLPGLEVFVSLNLDYQERAALVAPREPLSQSLFKRIAKWTHQLCQLFLAWKWFGVNGLRVSRRGWGLDKIFGWGNSGWVVGEREKVAVGVFEPDDALGGEFHDGGVDVVSLPTEDGERGRGEGAGAGDAEHGASRADSKDHRELVVGLEGEAEGGFVEVAGELGVVVDEGRKV